MNMQADAFFREGNMQHGIEELIACVDEHPDEAKYVSAHPLLYLFARVQMCMQSHECIPIQEYISICVLFHI